VSAEALSELFVAGGPVMWPLLAAGLLLWFLLGLRLIHVQRKSAILHASPMHCAALRRLLVDDSDAAVTRELTQLHERGGLRLVGEFEIALRARRVGLERYAALIDTLVISAPLLGLLGTVNGMMVTFDALTEMALFSQTGGIAGGIAEALTTTQMGLAIALPGLLFSRLLDRKARQLGQQLDALMAHCRRAAHGEQAVGAAPAEGGA
jgi:biopolymer transport protein ExbB